MKTMHYFLLIVGLILSSTFLIGCGSTLEAAENSTITEGLIAQQASGLEIESNKPISLRLASECQENDSTFVADVTIPDNTVMAPGETFVKTWRLRNSGACTWTSNYQFVSIDNNPKGLSTVQVGREVAPGGFVDLSINFNAPTAPGTYRSTWQLRTPDGTLFGTTAYVLIVVESEPPTPTPVAVTGLKTELFLAGAGGGGGGHGGPCGQPPETDSPTVQPRGSRDFGHICLWNFPLDEIITVELHAPNGTVYSDLFEFEDDGNGIIDRHIDLWLPVGLPTGEWYVVAYSANAQASGSLIVGDGRRAISAIPDFNINPFQDRSCGTYSAGEQVEILGANFPPNSEFPLGIYYKESNSKARLVFALSLTTDNQGNFHTSIRLDSSDSAGRYYAIVPQNKNDDTFSGSLNNCFNVQ